MSDFQPANATARSTTHGSSELTAEQFSKQATEFAAVRAALWSSFQFAECAAQHYALRTADRPAFESAYVPTFFSSISATE